MFFKKNVVKNVDCMLQFEVYIKPIILSMEYDMIAKLIPSPPPSPHPPSPTFPGKFLGALFITQKCPSKPVTPPPPQPFHAS